ncbi:hypothetical protein QQF64_007980 [Cirrhinus molitorella]|uniref:Uncharacterized protein n=1 Tax=Cirrhinus molitorella TaxID=172907 RepID=A0ABR3M4U7_9TELE
MPISRELRHSLVESEKRIGDSTPPCGDAKRRMACVRSSAKTIGRIVSDARDKSTGQPPSVERSSAVVSSTMKLRLAGPYPLAESSRGPEGYRYLERASGLVLATAAHILKLDRYRED